MAQRRARRTGHRRRRATRRMLIGSAVLAACLVVAVGVHFAWRRHADTVQVHLHEARADSLLTASRADDAVRELRGALAIDPNEATATRRVALLYAELGENTEAQFYLARALAHAPRDVELRERLAKVYLTSGNLDAAREEAAELRDIQPGNATALRVARAAVGDVIDADAPNAMVSADASARRALLRLTQRAIAERQIDSAIARATRLLNRWPDDVEGLVLRSDALAATADTLGASRDLRHALASDPTLPGARVRYATVQLREGVIAEARATLRSAAENAGTAYAEPTLALADLDVRAGAPQAAIASLRKLIEAHPRSRRAYEKLGFAHLAAGSARAALDAFHQAAAFDSADARGPYEIGLVLLATGKRDEARQSFQRAIDLAPRFLEPTVKLVEMDLADKRPRDAEARIRAALASAPRSAALYGLLGSAFGEAGDATAAEEALRRAIELEPGDEDARLRLAAMQGTAGRNDAAVASLNTVLQSNPRSARALMLSGVAFEQRGEIDRARQAYEQALAVDSLLPGAANNLAVLLMKHGSRADRSRALRLAQTAYRAAPGDPNVTDTLGWILYQAVLADPLHPRQMLAASIELLKESARQMPENGEVEYHLGMALRLRGDTVGSKSALEAALRAPSPPAVRDSARLALEGLRRW